MDIMKENNSKNNQNQQIYSKHELEDFVVSRYGVHENIFLKSSKLKQTIRICETEEKEHVIKSYILNHINPQILNNYVYYIMYTAIEFTH